MAGGENGKNRGAQRMCGWLHGGSGQKMKSVGNERGRYEERCIKVWGRSEKGGGQWTGRKVERKGQKVTVAEYPPERYKAA